MWQLTQVSKLLAFSLPILSFYYIKKRYDYSENNIRQYFKNKNIIITGSSQGIGKHLSNTLTKYDCKQFLLARSFSNEKDGNKITYKCDCSDFNEVSLVINDIFTNYGKPDILVNCAGSGDWKYITEMNKEEITNCINAPLMSSIWITRKILRHIPHNSDFQAIFIQSPAIIQPWKSSTIYTVSRWGLQGLVEALRADYYKTKIKIKDIIFGKVNSHYFINNPIASTRMPVLSKFIPTLTLNDTSQVIIKSIISNNNQTIQPFIIRLLTYIHYLFPTVIPMLNNYLD